MFLLIAGCTLVTRDEYTERMSGVSPSDSGTDGTVGMELSGSLSVPTDRFLDQGGLPVSVALHRFTFVTGDDGFVEIGEVFGSVDTVEDLALGASRPYQLDVPTLPVDEHYFDWGVSGVSHGAAYMLGAWFDADSDGEVGEGERLVGGASDVLLVHVIGATEELFADGDGWYLVTLDTGSASGEIFSDVFFLDDSYLVYDLEANLLPNHRVGSSLSGQTYQFEGDVRAVLFDLELVQSVWFQGDEPPHDPFFHGAEVHGGNFELAPMGVPRPEHLRSIANGQDYTVAGVKVAQFVGFAYRDDDGDETLDLESEQVLATSLTAGDQSTGLVYYEAAGLQAAFLGSQGLDLGWQLFKTEGEDGGGITPWSEGMLLGTDGL
ncbi:MAG: hypothetical protein GY913_02590 [Proteobacteria bacterium]|nr:hypothetical protein [Pseudomonadota bacterium]